MEYLRTISRLRPRTNTLNVVFRIRSVAAYAIHKFMQENNFVYVNTPIITGVTNIRDVIPFQRTLTNCEF